MQAQIVVALLCVCSLMSVGVMTPETASAAFPGTNGTIVFERDGDIYVLKRGATTPELLVGSPAWEGHPAISADGAKLAFASVTDGDSDVYIRSLDPDAPSLTNATQFMDAESASNETQPTWSPNGGSLAFSSDSNGGSCAPGGAELCDVFVLSLGSSEVRNLTPGSPGRDSSPDWSPDGSRLVFERDSGWSSDAGPIILPYVINVDGSGLRALVSESGAVSYVDPEWAPSGSEVAITRVSDGALVSVGTSPGSGWGSLSGSGAEPAWAPDGNELVYAQGASLVRATRSGSVVASLGPGSSPDWGPCPAPCSTAPSPSPTASASTSAPTSTPTPTPTSSASAGTPTPSPSPSASTIPPDAPRPSVVSITGPDTFYPIIRDGYRDAATFSFRASGDPASHSLSIVNSDGNTVLIKDFGEKRGSAEWRWSWNGRTEAGALVDRGRFQLVVRSLNAGGEGLAKAWVRATTGRLRRTGSDSARGGSATLSAGLGCVAQHDNGWAQLICVNGTYARAVFRLETPANATIDRGYIDFVQACCRRGRFDVIVSKDGPGRFIGTVEVGGRRAISIQRFIIKYTWYKKV